MAMFVLSSHATLTGVEEKKTGPSRFRPLFSGVTLDPIGGGARGLGRHELHGFARIQKPEARGGCAKCQAPSIRFRERPGCGAATRTVSSELDEGKLSCPVLRAGRDSNMSHLTRRLNSHHPTTLYANIKNRPL